jgi:hypothetical protein
VKLSTRVYSFETAGETGIAHADNSVSNTPNGREKMVRAVVGGQKPRVEALLDVIGKDQGFHHAE